MIHIPIDAQQQIIEANADEDAEVSSRGTVTFERGPFSWSWMAVVWEEESNG